MSSKTYSKICEICGKPFEARRKDARYCSQECGIKAARLRNPAPEDNNGSKSELQGVTITPKQPKQQPPQVETVIEMIRAVVKEEITEVKNELAAAIKENAPRYSYTTVKHDDTAATTVNMLSSIGNNLQNMDIAAKLNKISKDVDGITRQVAGLALENKVLKRALKCLNITCKYANNQYYQGYAFGHKDGDRIVYEDMNGKEVFVEMLNQTGTPNNTPKFEWRKNLSK
jgi:hypothetical protein